MRGHYGLSQQEAETYAKLYEQYMQNPQQIAAIQTSGNGTTQTMGTGVATQMGPTLADYQTLDYMMKAYGVA